MRSRWLAALLLPTFGMLLACPGTGVNSGGGKAISDETVDPGFQMFATPRDFDPPGTVFRVDRNGVRFYALEAPADFHRSVGTETFPTITTDRSRDFTAKSLFGFLNLKADAKATRSLVATFFLSGAQRERTADSEINALLRDHAAEIDWKPNNRYFVIRETISADSVSYQFNRESATTLETDLSIGQVVQNQGNLEWKSNATVQLVQRLSPRQRVFYKVDELKPKGGNLGGGTPEIERQTVTTPLSIASEDSTPPPSK